MSRAHSGGCGGGQSPMSSLAGLCARGRSKAGISMPSCQCQQTKQAVGCSGSAVQCSVLPGQLGSRKRLSLSLALKLRVLWWLGSSPTQSPQPPRHVAFAPLTMFFFTITSLNYINLSIIHYYDTATMDWIHSPRAVPRHSQLQSIPLLRRLSSSSY